MALEIERKFVIHEDSETKLIKAGAVLKKHVTFTDAYFDTNNYDLSLADTWLRKRDGKWQLKIPPRERCTSLTCQYMELDSDMEIASSLLHNFPILANGSETGATMVEISQCLSEFARFTTHRTSYTIHDFHVDFDRTDFGFEVGEIELMNDDIQRDDGVGLHLMVEKVDKFASSIDFSTSERVIGKVEEFLQRFRPEHYGKLVAANIMGNTV
ncbi:thiamine-triphosphatase-like [Anneissia japonica]|uniref:thiamine-triphosphatase-like n=1 Tax=Anneissia japonica TaxID=1529436 RepID=UPI0014258ED3|nr:thiamine-triphosphatase-like [Anneissia japonica]